MFRVTVTDPADPDLLYFWEMQMQIEIALLSHSHIETYFAHQEITKDLRERHSYSPLQVISHCSSFLSAVAIISKILFPEKQGHARGARLCRRLGITSLPAINSRAVRNSYEHVDERLDRLSGEGLRASVCWVDMVADVPVDAQVVLRRINPNSRTIEFLGDRLEIHACYSELQSLKAAIGTVFNAQYFPRQRPPQ